MTTIMTCSARFSSVKFCRCGALTKDTITNLQDPTLEKFKIGPTYFYDDVTVTY